MGWSGHQAQGANEDVTRTLPSFSRVPEHNSEESYLFLTSECKVNLRRY